MKLKQKPLLQWNCAETFRNWLPVKKHSFFCTLLGKERVIVVDKTSQLIGKSIRKAGLLSSYQQTISQVKQICPTVSAQA